MSLLAVLVALAIAAALISVHKADETEANEVSFLSVGDLHTCAVSASGAPECWGWNGYGQLGRHTRIFGCTIATCNARSGEVDGLAWQANVVVAGYRHSCALGTANRVACWGANEWGQLGGGSWYGPASCYDFGPCSVTPIEVVGLDGGATSIAIGQSHTCALTVAGEVHCWGGNKHGELGRGLYPPAEPCHTDLSVPCGVTPRPVAGLNGVLRIDAGRDHNCAVLADDSVVCWGSNSNGQLGDGSLGDLSCFCRAAPVHVQGLNAEVTAIAAGSRHTCALTSAGGVQCWGSNEFGQLGDGTVSDRAMPAPVAGLTSGVVAISATGDHTCALLTDGSVTCWGDNAFGQLGNGSIGGDPACSCIAFPVSVAGLPSAAIELAAGGHHTCVLLATGQLKCWGRNGQGQLGDGTTVQRSSPGSVIDLGTDKATPTATATATPVLGVKSIATGLGHTCVVTEVGGVKCWGSNRYGQLGDGTTQDRFSPVDVQGMSSGVAAVEAADDYTCAVLQSGLLKCWGTNEYGQLGLGTNTGPETCGSYPPCSTLPVDVTGAGSVIAVSAARHHACALTSTGGIKCWGLNQGGELGDGTTEQRLSPTDVSGLSAGVVAVSAGGDVYNSAHTCALTSGGGVKCWGNNAGGLLGVGDGFECQPYCATPTDVTGLTSGVRAVAAGYVHTCAVTDANAVKCWGQNYYGALGIGSVTDGSAVPVDVTGLPDPVAQISTQGGHTCALATSAALLCWGSNYSGQLGIGSSTGPQLCANSFPCSPAPVAVVGLPGGAGIVSAGTGHTCAVTTTGTMKCWGSDHYGQLGDGVQGSEEICGGTYCSTTPGDVVGLGEPGAPTPTRTPTASPTPTATPTPGARGTVSGTVWHDMDMDGQRADEPGLAGWQVYLATACCPARVLAQDTTDADGSYSLTNVPAGPQKVCLAVQPGWAVTSASGEGHSYYCDLSPFPVPYATTTVDVIDGAATQADFGVVDRDAALTGTLDCPSKVVVQRQFECSFAVRNVGNVSLSLTAAGIYRVICFDPQPCIVGGAFGRSVILGFVSSEPPWTEVNPQYGDPFWQPLGSGMLAPGDSATVRVVVIAYETNDPGASDLLCLTASGRPATDTYVSPFASRFNLGSCQRVVVGTTNLPTTTPPSTQTPTPMESDTSASTATRTPELVRGDSSCDGIVSAIDAALILQWVAGRIAGLPCGVNADVDGDGSTDSVDSLLVLQYVAGLLDDLPAGVPSPVP